MPKLKLLLLIFGIFFAQFVHAQTRISGKVIDEKSNAPISGATVSVKNNTNISTSTAQDGSFTISAPANSRLVISFVGYRPVEIAASAASSPVRLSAGEATLSEVVVVGYGSRLKRDVTGSVTKIAAREVNNTPATSFETAIQGRASGVLVQQQNGKLGQGINIRIRGASSVSAGNEPLYVVDGIPVISSNLSSNEAPTNALADLNMNDIASIDILKDASATAIYGSQGSNGVVLITTKRGRTGTSKIEVNYYTGMQKPTGKREFLNAQQYIDFFRQSGIGAAKQDFAAGYFNTLQEAIDDYNSLLDSRFTRYSAGNEDWKTAKVNTNWQDQAFQRAPMSQYDLNFSGGTEKTKFYASGQYLDQKGIMIRNNYKRYNARLNLDQQVNNWLSFGMNMSFARSENNRLSNDNQFSTPLQVVALSPITPAIDPRTGLLSGALDPTTGNPNTNFPVYYNPLLSVENSTYKTLVNRTLGNVYGSVHIAKGLNFRSELGMDQLNQSEEGYYGALTARNTGVARGSGFYYTTQVLNITTNNYFNYNITPNDRHSIDLTAGMAFQKGRTLISKAEAEQFPSDAYQKLNAGALKTEASSGSTENTLLSYFLRGNYKLQDRYIFTLSGRVDGSSRFGVNNRYAFFPAASVGWILTEERFLSNVKWLNLFKLKASYGANGNDRIPDFASRGLFSAAPYGGEPGQVPSQLLNPNLKWETTVGTDVGFEASMFNNRLSVEVDLYQRNTKDLLLTKEVPGTSGFATQYSNIGNLTNRGIEVSINTTNIASKNFRWTSNLNFSANKNKITNLGGQVLGTAENKAMEGHPLGVFFTKEYAGVDPENGDALYYINKMKDGALDRTTTNNSNDAADVVVGDPNPDFFYGFGNTFNYRGIDLDVLLQGLYGNQVFNGGGQYMSASGSNGFDNQTIDQLRAWKNPGDITDVPEARLFYANGTNSSSRYISTGSYMRVKSVTLGYNLPSALTKKINIERVRIYARALNLFTFTKYEGWDPEVNADFQANNNNINLGQDFYSAPQIKSIVFGVNISL
ncbi:MAG TPA: TonB-dependent receptor [Segetibacter sp.]|nr:TonB-dependent receptor [Segetibacter sp.]